ncbi:5'/3'-nucleotidase SurE [Microbulbifer taiwanensis]|uniref:5'-nucleotidase n=1 Tax=Microbulbifer taiwanensis TaxID=986746 RepID=A0ABW1YNS4_9GAMM|nr:5'/3'-nucleotidase SurE [Microbulbifer taiwanensis]
MIKKLIKRSGVLLFSLSLLPLSACAESGEAQQPLRILLTNDDGWDAPGIQAMRTALIDAGHDVTLVAPLTGQSGKGGGFNTHVGEGVSVEEKAPGVWAVDSTPTDSVRAALGAIMAEAPPQLIVSGSNFGQNLGQPAAHQSGTIGATLQGIFSGIPAIAVSVGVDFRESKSRFPSTQAAFAPAAQFTVSLIEELQKASGGQLLPPRTALNVNVPVPYEKIKGIEFAPLSLANGVPFRLLDTQREVVKNGGGALQITPFLGERDIDAGSDIDLYNRGYITISAIDGNVTAVQPEQLLLEKLQP